MRIVTCVLVCCLTAVAVCAEQTEPKWENLFDGKTLKGWTQKNGKAKYEVKDGVIIGTTVLGEPNSFLCTDRLFGNFVLELEFKVDPGLSDGRLRRKRA